MTNTEHRSGGAVIPHPDVRPGAERTPAPTVPALPQALGVPAILALQRTAGNRAVGALLRDVAPPPQQKADVGDATVSFEWNARWAPKAGAVTFVAGDAGKLELTMPVQAGTEGKLSIDVQAHVEPAPILGQKLPGWTLTSRCEWPVTLGRDGHVTPGVPARSHRGGKGSTVQQSGPPDGNASADVAQFVLTQGYMGETKSTEVSFYVGGSITEPANTGSESFVVALDIKGIEGPQVEIGKVQVFQRQTHDVQFFRDKNIRVSGDERASLMAWYAGLSKLTRRRLKAGKQIMRLETFASPTGRADENQLRYANGRLHAVQAILNRFVTHWEATPFGEDKPPEGELEPAEERRAHEHSDPTRLIARLTVEDERTPGADNDDDFDLLPTD
jgi:hypothetical protein